MLRSNNLDKVILTRVMCGDTNNDTVYNIYAKDPELANWKLQKLVDNFDRYVSEPIDAIFDGTVDTKDLWNMIAVLTFWDSIQAARKEYIMSANDLFFALLVNHTATRDGKTQKIRSYSALYAAKQSAQDNGTDLDYRDFIVKDETFANEYIKASVKPFGYNVEFDIEVPIKYVGLKKLGIIKLCTDNVPARLTFKEDNDRSTYTIPAFIWMNMMKKGVSKFNRVRFTKHETKKVSGLLDSDPHFISDILDANDFSTLLKIEREGSFGVDYDRDDGRLILQQIKELPSLDNRQSEAAGLAWRQIGQRDYKLECPEFYLVNAKKDAFNIIAAN